MIALSKKVKVKSSSVQNRQSKGRARHRRLPLRLPRRRLPTAAAYHATHRAAAYRAAAYPPPAPTHATHAAPPSTVEADDVMEKATRQRGRWR